MSVEHEHLIHEAGFSLPRIMALLDIAAEYLREPGDKHAARARVLVEAARTEARVIADMLPAEGGGDHE